MDEQHNPGNDAPEGAPGEPGAEAGAAGSTGGGGDTPASEAPTEATAPRRLFRSRQDRVLGGVCGGLGQYFGIDPVIFRIAAVALTVAAGTGVLLYLAAVLLVPEGEGTPAPAGSGTRRSGLTILAVLVGVLVLSPLILPPVFLVGAVLGPLAVLLGLGLLTWWLVSGQGAGDGPRQVLGRGALGVAVLAGCGALALGGAFAAGVGGGTVAAGLVIAAGLILVVGAFTGWGRRLVLPALAVAIPVAVVSAAGIDLNGGVGDRHFRPAAADQLQDRYKLGMGELVVDLRNSKLPPGDTRLGLDLGVGEARLLVPPNVCVSTRSRVGLGAAELFDRFEGGADVDHREPALAPPGTPRLVVDAKVGVGHFLVGHREPARRGFGPGPDGGRGFGRGPGFDRRPGRWRGEPTEREPGNQACQGGQGRVALEDAGPA